MDNPDMNPNSPQSQAEAMATEIAVWFCYGDSAQTCTALTNRISTALSNLIAEKERLKKEQSETVEAFNALNGTKDKLIATLKSKIEALGGLHVLRDDWTPTPENIAKLPANIRSQLTATEAKLREEYPCKCGATIRVLRPQFCTLCMDKEFATIHKYFSTLTAEKKEEAK